MFKKVMIQNIQSHKHSEINLDPGVNVIVGNSDQGKSALFNGIYWNMFHRPLGEPHRSWGGGTMVSEITLDDDSVVTLTKDKQSVYSIKSPDGHIAEFKAFGAEPPTEVKDIFNINRKINVQQQLEIGAPIFLISESPGDVAKFFNKVAGLYKINEVTKTGTSAVSEADRAVKNIKEEIKAKKTELLKYAGIDDLKELVDLANEKQKTIDSITGKIDDLSKALGRVSLIKESLSRLHEKIDLEENIDQALLLVQNNSKYARQSDKLKGKLMKIKKARRIIDGCKDKTSILPLIKKAIRLRDVVYGIKKQEADLFAKLEKIRRIKQRIDRNKKDAKRTNEKYLNLMPEFCPLCGGGTGLLKHDC